MALQSLGQWAGYGVLDSVQQSSNKTCQNLENNRLTGYETAVVAALVLMLYICMNKSSGDLLAQWAKQPVRVPC